eukprot:731640-Amorphochlora_amoeboformis.AAC.1
MSTSISGPVPQAPSAHPLPLPSSAPLLPQPHPSAGLPPTPIPHGADRDRFTRALGSLRQYSRSGKRGGEEGEGVRYTIRW